VLRIPHCLDNRLTVNCEILATCSSTYSPVRTSQEAHSVSRPTRPVTEIAFYFIVRDGSLLLCCVSLWLFAKLDWFRFYSLAVRHSDTRITAQQHIHGTERIAASESKWARQFPQNNSCNTWWLPYRPKYVAGPFKEVQCFKKIIDQCLLHVRRHIRGNIPSKFWESWETYNTFRVQKC
jgi:hypothetical protein